MNLKDCYDNIDYQDNVVVLAETEWAGYTAEGMDYRGHLHPHPTGGFYRMGDGLRGWYCAARLVRVNGVQECIDPDPRHFVAKGDVVGAFSAIVRHHLKQVIMGDWDLKGELVVRVFNTEARRVGQLVLVDPNPMLTVMAANSDGTVRAYSNGPARDIHGNEIKEDK